MGIKIIADPGSCHSGDFAHACGLIQVAACAGADAIKFQLFDNAKNGNIALPFRWFGDLKKYAADIGLECFASVWDKIAMKLLYVCGCKSIKFAYSMRNEKELIKEALEKFENVYVSGPALHDWPEGCKRLFCVPEYPVVNKLAFDGLFPALADGFSDHTMGIEQTIQAVVAGAQIIEKHITLDYPKVICPDHKFALKPTELEEMCSIIRGMK